MDTDAIPSALARRLLLITNRDFIVIQVGKSFHRVRLPELLPFVWGRGLDSDCHVCNRPFRNGQDFLLRTIGRAAPKSPHIRIFNRHFACAHAAGIPYVPISHAWHKEVSDTQASGTTRFNFDSRPSDQKATRQVYETTAAVLDAVTRDRSPSEIWHDYISVPQWQRDVQAVLIRSIPTIYGGPREMVVHWDDMTNIQLCDAYDSPDKDRMYGGVAAVTQSRWFQRMWVTLEYLQGNSVFILTKDLVIFHADAASLASKMRRNYRWDDIVARREMNRKGYSHDMAVSWADMQSVKWPRGNHPTIGDAIFILGNKNCRDFGDYFIALATMMGIPPAAGPSEHLDNFSRFHHLAVESLRRGDFTPLLITPIPSERLDIRAPWVAGYSCMSKFFFTLGLCWKQAETRQVVRDGRIEPELEHVGTVETWVDFTGGSGAMDFYPIVSKILDTSGTNAPAFCDTIDRIFPAEEARGFSRHPDKDTPAEVTYDMIRIGRLIEAHMILRAHPGAEGLSSNVSDIIYEMGLDRPSRGSGRSRFQIACGDVETFRVNTVDRGLIDRLAQVRCPCGRQYLFRLVCWDPSKLASAELYRIPGLFLDGSVDNGVGIVMSGEQRIGHMIFGTPACDCGPNLRRVYIGHEFLS